jgi:hypothetical protein
MIMHFNKILTVTFVITIISSLPVAAQLFYGVKGGLNIADIAITNFVNPDVESGYTLKTGIHAGMFCSVEIHERFILSTELLYSNKGVKAIITKIHLHYINIPFLVQYLVSDKFMVEMGPELGYLISATSRYGNVGDIWNNKLDVGLDAGVQYSITKRLKAIMRYNIGFSSVIDPMVYSGSNNNQQTDDVVRYQNRVLQFSLAYVLREKKI